MELDLILITVIFILSIIQSLFGVGLLVFGTPMLLIMGYSFDEALSFLLPSSIIISCAQLFNQKVKSVYFRNKIFFFSAPGIIIGLLIVLSNIISINTGFLVGLMLLITVLIRSIPYLFGFLKKILSDSINTYSFLMGIIHGVSNMGGGFLTILVTTIFEKKDEQRKNIALGYLIFGLTQILVLFIFKHTIFGYLSIIFPILSFIVYHFIGNKIFKYTSQKTYNNLMSILMLLYGLVLLLINFSQ